MGRPPISTIGLGRNSVSSGDGYLIHRTEQLPFIYWVLQGAGLRQRFESAGLYQPRSQLSTRSEMAGYGSHQGASYEASHAT